MEISNNPVSSTPKMKEAYNWLGELAIIHITGKETGGRFSMVELFATKEGEVPWHIHHREDEGFYIMEGEITVYIDDREIKGHPGDFIFAPKGAPHRYSVDTPGHARVLLTFSPAGFEDFVRATSVATISLTPPPPTPIEMDFEKLAQLAEKFGAEFVDPPNDQVI